LSGYKYGESEIYSLKLKKQTIDGDTPSLTIGDYMFIPTTDCLRVDNLKTNTKKCISLQ
jgi:glyoxylate utilization-related uncharacterized protein